MYCKCNNRQPVKQTAMGKEFTVCSKRLGGCGEEINDVMNFSEVDEDTHSKVPPGMYQILGTPVLTGLDGKLLDPNKSKFISEMDKIAKEYASKHYSENNGIRHYTYTAPETGTYNITYGEPVFSNGLKKAQEEIDELYNNILKEQKMMGTDNSFTGLDLSNPAHRDYCSLLATADISINPHEIDLEEAITYLCENLTFFRYRELSRRDKEKLQKIATEINRLQTELYGTGK
jgi:hypothetical protein